MFMKFVGFYSMNRNILVASAAALVVMTTATFAHDGATGIVKERMDAMSNMSKVMKTMSAMMRGKEPLNAELIKTSTRTILSHSGSSLTELFPLKSNTGSSAARDEIWSNWEGFNALADQLKNFANGMEAAAKNGLMDDNSTMKHMGSNMIGGTMMGGKSHIPSQQMLASMPVNRVFDMVAQTCSACHKKFRIKK